MILLLLILLWLAGNGYAEAACTGSSPSWSCTGDQASLDLLINSNNPGTIVAGDTVTVTTSATWQAPLHILASPPFTLACNAGVTFTLGGSYVDGSPGGFIVYKMESATAGVYRLTGCTIDSSSFVSSAGILNIYGKGVDRFRVDHVTIDNVKASRAFTVWGSYAGSPTDELSGLFDHDTCNTVANSSVQCFGVYGWWEGAEHQFLWGKHPGTNHATYVEDSTCNYGWTADDCTDGGYGASYVFRYNHSNLAIGIHGAESAPRGGNLTEWYRNTFSNPLASHYAQNWRTGPDFAFDNTYTGANWTAINLTLYRPVWTSGYFGGTRCNGASSWDGNLGSGTDNGAGVAPTGNPGYPCLDQTGWYFPGATPPGSSAIQMPAYFVNNTLNGSLLSFANNDGPPTTWTTGYITANVDYYTDNGASCSGANCTTGVGRGTLASRPGNCTTGVGYWATDQGSWNQSGDGLGSGVLYKCTATNTWTLYYTPYTYPHPLQGVVASNAISGSVALSGGVVMQ